LPTPFWIYFVPIVLATFGLLPPDSPAYEWIGLHALPSALVLMLIGTPVTSLIKMGPKATAAMSIAVFSMIAGIVLSFAVLTKFMPAGSYKGAGAILATWVGGSANMIAVKEVLSIPDSSMAPLIIVDTVMSYLWMAFLILGAAYQKQFDAWMGATAEQDGAISLEGKKISDFEARPWTEKALLMLIVIGVGFAIGEATIFMGRNLATHTSLLSAKAWTVLLASLVAVCLAMTNLRKLENWKASRCGSYLLYFVLAAIGAKTTLRAAIDAPIFLLFGAGVLLIHGALSILLGRIFKVPLFLIAVASQANVGGAVSAPIVAGVYRPGVAHIGVLMAILGALIGTYTGLFGSWMCRFLEIGIR